MASTEAMRVRLRDLRAEFPLPQARDEKTKRALPGPAFAFDRQAFGESAEILEQDGLNMVDVPMTAAVMGPPSTLAYELITTGRLVHDGDPILAEHVANTTAVLTDRGMKVTRSKHGSTPPQRRRRGDGPGDRDGDARAAAAAQAPCHRELPVMPRTRGRQPDLVARPAGPPADRPGRPRDVQPGRPARRRRRSIAASSTRPAWPSTRRTTRASHRETYKIRRVIEAFGLRMPIYVNYAGVVVDSISERLGVDGFTLRRRRPGERGRLGRSGRTTTSTRASSGACARGSSRASSRSSCGPTRTGRRGSGSRTAPRSSSRSTPRRGVRRAALKRWTDDDEPGAMFANLFLPDAVYKYRTPLAATSLVGPTAPSSRRSAARPGSAGSCPGEPWPLPNPLGEVPVIPFPNKPDLHLVGESELGKVVPIQDAINANIANVMLAGLYGAFRQKVMLNFALEVDPATGAPVQPFDVALDSLITVPPNAPGEAEPRLAEFSQTDLAGYIKVHETLVQAIATASRFPPHYLLGTQGTFPSGECLTAVERGISAVAGERGDDWKDPLEDAMRLAFRIKARAPGISAAAAARYEKWADMTGAEAAFRNPETKSESQHVDAVTKKKDLDVPRRQLWTELGYSQQQILDWEADLAAAPPDPPAVPIAGAGHPTSPGRLTAQEARSHPHERTDHPRGRNARRGRRNASPDATGGTRAGRSVSDPTAQPAVAPAPDPSAPDVPEGLGDAGKRALDAMKAERNAALAASKAAERELEQLRTATLSESEKAIAAARKAGADEVTERLHARVRRAEVKLALARAGAVPSLIEDLANAAEFAALMVDDTDQVTGLDDALKAHKARVPDAYRAAGDPGPGLGRRRAARTGCAAGHRSGHRRRGPARITNRLTPPARRERA